MTATATDVLPHSDTGRNDTGRNDAVLLDQPGRIPHRVTIRPAPRREPPFDDEAPQRVAVSRHDQRLPFAMPAPPQPWRPIAPRPNGLPEPTAWARRMLVGLIETAGGHRPLHQLASLLSQSVGRGLCADFERASAAGRAHWLHCAGVRTVRGGEPCAGVAELSATLEVGDRVRAVAMRLECTHGRWRCTRLQLG